jgi:hypothetical protein
LWLPAVFVEDARARAELLLEAPGAVKRRRPPHAIDIAHRVRNFDVAFDADFLADERHGKERREVGRSDRLARTRMQYRRRRRRQVRRDIVPGARNALFAELILDALAHAFLPRP